MSLPSKDQLIAQSCKQTRAERQKAGENLGAAYKQDSNLLSLLKDIRTYEKPATPHLDEASVLLGKYLPTQQSNAAKHFDTEQLCMSAAASAGFLDILEAEVRGPGAQNLNFAAKRLAKACGNSKEMSERLFKLLVELPMNRKKAMIKGCITHQTLIALDKFIDWCAEDSKRQHLLWRTIHGCSSAKVEQHLPSLYSIKNISWLHIARYHSKVILKLMTQDLDKAKSNSAGTYEGCQTIWNNFASYLSQHGDAKTIFIQKEAEEIIKLASNYPCMEWRSGSDYDPEVPCFLRAHAHYFLKHHSQSYLTMVKNFSKFRTTEPKLIITNGTHENAKTKDLFEILKWIIPSSTQSQCPEAYQLRMPDVMSSVISRISTASFPPDVPDLAQKLITWYDLYAAMFPALNITKHIHYTQILNSCIGSLDATLNASTARVLARREIILKDWIKSGHKKSELTVDQWKTLLGKAQVNGMHQEKAWQKVMEIFMPRFEDLLTKYSKMQFEDGKNKNEEGGRDSLMAILTNLVSTSPSFKTVDDIRKLTDKFSFVSVSYPSFKPQIVQKMLDFATRNSSYELNKAINFTKQYYDFLTSTSTVAMNLVYDIVSQNPLEWFDIIETILNYHGSGITLSWAIRERFWKLLSTDILKDKIKRKNCSEVVQILKGVPHSLRSPVIVELMQPGVSTMVDKQKLVSIQDVSEEKIRKSMEQATSSSSSAERFAALTRLVIATRDIAGISKEEFGKHLEDPTSCKRALARSSTTLAYIAKRIKNVTFEDRVIVQNLAFDAHDQNAFSRALNAVWLAPGVGSAQFNLWYEMLEDHIQHPSATIVPVTIEDNAVLTAISDFVGRVSEIHSPMLLWTNLMTGAFSLGIRRDNIELIDFALNIGVKVGSAKHGSGDPLVYLVKAGIWRKVAAMLCAHVNDTKRITSIINRLLEQVQEHCVDESLRPTKRLELLRILIQSSPLASVFKIPIFVQHLTELVEKEKSKIGKTVDIADILTPPVLPSTAAFKDSSVIELEAQAKLPLQLLEKANHGIWKYPFLLDYLCNVAMKSWSAKNFVTLAWRAQLNLALAQHKNQWRDAHPKTPHAYTKPTGKAFKKVLAQVASKFSNDLIAFSPSALHLPKTLKWFAKHDPQVIYDHLPPTNAAANGKEIVLSVDNLTTEDEKLHFKAKCALLGPFTPVLFDPSQDARAPQVATANTLQLPKRFGRIVGRRRLPVRVNHRRTVTPKQFKLNLESMDAGVVAQMSIVEHIASTWKRGQSPKSVDNNAFFIPLLCRGFMNWHPNQVLALGELLQNAVLNTMRTLENQKKFMILWTLLPTTTYADVVTFLQTHDSSFIPKEEGEDTTEDVDEEGEDDTGKAKPRKTETPKAEEAPTASKLALPKSIAEAAIRGTTHNDEPLAPLPFLMSPTFLSSDYSRTAIAAIQTLQAFVPEGLLTNALSHLLDQHRKSLKTTAHKTIIRLLTDQPSEAHWDILLKEWNVPSTHRDVRITIIDACFNSLLSSDVQQAIVKKSWEILEKVVDYKSPDVVSRLLSVTPTVPHHRGNITPDYVSVLLNNRVKNQFIQTKCSTIDPSWSTDYVTKILIPLLQIDKGIQGSDLQFLAYTCLAKWSPFVKDKSEGVAELLCQYLLASLKSDLLWQSPKQREVLAAVARFNFIVRSLVFLCSLDQNADTRATWGANFHVPSSHYSIPAAPKMIAEVVNALLKRLDSFADATPADTLRYQHYSQLLSCLGTFLDYFDKKAVGKENLTAEEEDAILLPIINSPYKQKWAARWALRPLYHYNRSKLDDIEGYCKILPIFVKTLALDRSLPTNLVNEFALRWTHNGYLTLGIELVTMLDQIDQFKFTTTEKYIFTYMVHTVLQSLCQINPHYTFVAGWIKHWKAVRIAACESFGGLPQSAFQTLSTNLHSVVSNSLMGITSASMTTETKKAIIEYVVLDTIESYKASLRLQCDPAHASKRSFHQKFIKSCIESLSMISGQYIATLLPNCLNEVIDFFVTHGLFSLATKIFNEVFYQWNHAQYIIPDPELAGIGYSQVDQEIIYKFTCSLIRSDLLDGAVRTAENYIDGGYIEWCINTLHQLLQRDWCSAILRDRDPILWWQAINAVYSHNLCQQSPLVSTIITSAVKSLSIAKLPAHVDSSQDHSSLVGPRRTARSTRSGRGEFRGASRASSGGLTRTTGSTIQQDAISAAQSAQITRNLDIITELSDGSAIANGIHPSVAFYIPFQDVKDAIASAYNDVAVAMTFELGSSQSLVPEQNDTSTTRYWRPEVADAVVDLSSRGDSVRSVIGVHFLGLTTRITRDPPATAASSASSSGAK